MEVQFVDCQKSYMYEGGPHTTSIAIIRVRVQHNWRLWATSEDAGGSSHRRWWCERFLHSTRDCLFCDLCC